MKLQGGFVLQTQEDIIKNITRHNGRRPKKALIPAAKDSPLY
jgi:hypothetical protein